MANACFCAALGVSLVGLVLVNYLNVKAGAASDQTIGRFAGGKLKLFGTRSVSIPSGLAATIMALPVVFLAYSSFFLLIGLVTMILGNQRGDEESHLDNILGSHNALTLVPIFFGLLCLCAVVLVCEAGTWGEGGEGGEGGKGGEPQLKAWTSAATSCCFVESPVDHYPIPHWNDHRPEIRSLTQFERWYA